MADEEHSVMVELGTPNPVLAGSGTASMEPDAAGCQPEILPQADPEPGQSEVMHDPEVSMSAEAVLVDPSERESEQRNSLYDTTVQAAQIYDEFERKVFAAPAGRRPLPQRTVSKRAISQHFGGDGGTQGAEGDADRPGLRRADSMAYTVANGAYVMVDMHSYGVTSDIRPWVIYSFAITCIIVFVFEMKRNDFEFAPQSENLFYGPTYDVLLDMGGKSGDKIVDEQEYWRLFTANFLHAGVIHLMFNMCGLFAYGVGAEKAHGHMAVLYVSLTSGVFSFVVSCIFTPHVLAVGLSGTISGLLGSLWGHVLSSWNTLDSPCCVLIGLFFESCLSLSVGLCPYIDNFCHLSGFCFGVAAGMSVYSTTEFDDHGKELPASARAALLKLVGAAGSVIMVLMATYWCFHYLDVESNPFETCGWCQHVSCYELPPSNPWWHCGACYLEPYSYKSFVNGTLKVVCPPSSDEAKVYVNASVDWYSVYQDDPEYGLCLEYCDTWF